MTLRSFQHTFLLSLSLASLLVGGCDTQNAAANAAGAAGIAPDKPGPGGVTPTIPPQVDPLHDPTPEPFELPLPPKGIDGGDAPVPWKLKGPAAKGGCSCRLVCTYLEDRRIDCVTVCNGTGCE